MADDEHAATARALPRFHRGGAGREALEKIRKRAEKMARAFDMPFLAVASATEAMQCAREVLGQAGPGGFNLS